MALKKLIVIGDGDVGKTSLLIVFSTNEFPIEYVPVVCEAKIVNMEVCDKQIELGLIDVAGGEDFYRLRPLCYADVDVVLLCISIEKSDILKNISNVYAPELKRFIPNVPFILVGNKKDLRNDPKTIQEFANKNKRLILQADGKMLADQIGANCYMECSAKENDGVKDVFEVAAALALKNEKVKITKKKCTLV